MGKTGESRRRKATGPSFRGWQPAPERRILSCANVRMAFLSIRSNWILRFSKMDIFTRASGPLYFVRFQTLSTLHIQGFTSRNSHAHLHGKIEGIKEPSAGDGGRGVDRAALRKRNRTSRSEGGGSGRGRRGRKRLSSSPGIRGSTACVKGEPLERP